MVDIHSLRLRLGEEEKERKKKEEITGQKYNVRICCTGRPMP